MPISDIDIGNEGLYLAKCTYEKNIFSMLDCVFIFEL